MDTPSYRDRIHPEIKQIILDLIAPMHKLKSLELSDIKLGNTFLFDILSRNPLSAIEIIAITACGIYMINDDILSFIGQCEKLRRLSITESCARTDPELIREVAYRGWDIEVKVDMVDP